MAQFDPFLSLDCARVEGVGAQSKESKALNFAVQRSRAIVLQARRAKHIRSKNMAMYSQLATMNLGAVPQQRLHHRRLPGLHRQVQRCVIVLSRKAYCHRLIIMHGTLVKLRILGDPYSTERGIWLGNMGWLPFFILSVPPLLVSAWDFEEFAGKAK